MAEDIQESKLRGRIGDPSTAAPKNIEKIRIFRESDKLLHLAEELQEKYERSERRFMAVLATFLCALATAVGVGIATLNYRDPNFSVVTWQSGTRIITFSYFVIMSIYAFDSFSKLRRAIRRDRRAYFEIVDMLRELKRHIDRKNSISLFEKAQFLIRLSRLDIGTGVSLTQFFLGTPEKSPRYKYKSKMRSSQLDSIENISESDFP